MKKSTFTLLILLAIQTQAQTINITGPAGSGQFGKTVTVLTNGNYVVTDPLYDDGAVADVGAVYLYNGSTHTIISTLKGSHTGDSVGNGGIKNLTNGNFVISSPRWDNETATNAGAVTWGSGITGVSGLVNSSNSLVGSKAEDSVGSGGLLGGILILNNGNYLVFSPRCDNGAIIDAGAVTWGNGSTGITGIISSSNSLLGSAAGDKAGYYGATMLSNGNYVIKSPFWDNGTATDAGAVTWANGNTGITGVISSSNSLVGTSTNDLLVSGSQEITVLSNGNYIVISSYWDNGTASDAGAMTWANGNTGTTGVVSSSNSLVGTSTNDLVGSKGITVLSNGNCIVISPYWDNGVATDAGAVTWVNGNTGVSGIINSSNSLVGSNVNDRVGLVFVLTNGNYVVASLSWDNGAAIEAGAATWANGNTGITGIISSGNSLVGSKSNDMVGAIDVLSNGNYVVSVPRWDNGLATDAGAVIWANGNTGIAGFISASNSLVGTTASDYVGSNIIPLTNGNYIVYSPSWHNGSIISAGAATWRNGTITASGVVSSSNSMVGSKAYDFQYGKIFALTNGNYVVSSPMWDSQYINDIGAVTWGNGATGTSGAISNTNSLVGTESGDQIGTNQMVDGVMALNNGNYLVFSPYVNSTGFHHAGAITWCNGTTVTFGTVNSNNSIVGSHINDLVGYQGAYGVTTLSNGNYLITSSYWSNGQRAVTWCSATSGISGIISSTNSALGPYDLTVLPNGNYVVSFLNWFFMRQYGATVLVNGNTGVIGTISAANALVGSTNQDWLDIKVVALANSNYVVLIPNWNNEAAIDAGAIAWGNGTTGITGVVSKDNSLVGSKTNDRVGSISTFNNGDYVVISPYWDNGLTTDAGAISLGSGNAALTGSITSCNSVMGTAASGGSSMNPNYNNTYNYLIVGRPLENIVTIFNHSSDVLLAFAQDSIAFNVNNLTATPIIASGGCRIIATLTPNGASPVSGTVKASVWVESSVPVYGDDPFVARHYQITPETNGSSSTGRITLYFTQEEFDNFNAHPGSALNLPTGDADATGKANLRVGKYPGTSSNSSGLPGTYSGTPVIIDPNDADIVWNSNLNRWEVSFDVTGFSGFVVQTKASPLPLQLLNFSAALSHSDVLVSWSVTNEINTKNFEVERSKDGRNFIAVGTVAAINTSGDHSYTYIDAGAALLNTSTLYYRLKQTDRDGRYSNSQIVVLHLTKDNSIAVYPNPVTNITTLSFGNAALLGTSAVLTDFLGKRVKQIIIRNYHQQVDMSSLSNGVYLLKLADGSIVKLIKN